MNLRLLILLLSIWASPALHAKLEVYARFEPNRISRGNTTNYVVEIVESDDGSSMISPERIDSLQIPQVKGLILRGMRTEASYQNRISNNIAEYSVTQKLIIDAIPETVGSHTIPSYSFEYKNMRLQIPQATLHVIERSADAPPASSELVFLDLEPPKKLYIGQSVLVNLKLFVAESIQLRGFRTFNRDADGFTVIGGPPEDSVESAEIINGRRYQVYSWPLMITPIRTGKQDINFQFGLSVLLPDRRNHSVSPFGNSIFDSLLGRPEQLNIYTRPTQVDVLPLPTEDQPDSFLGAIGRFNLEISTDAESTRVNEPIMLSIKLSGSGNFERIQSLELPEAKGWRSYPPESVFEPSGVKKSLLGNKRFDYVFIPEKAGKLKLPIVNFSFFDPKAEKYIKLTGPELEIDVAPSNRSTIPPAASIDKKIGENAATSSVELSKSLNPDDLLLTLDYRPEGSQKLFNSPLAGPLFYWLNSIFLLLFSTSAIVLYKRRRELQCSNYELVREAKEELKAAMKGTQSNDMTTFFSNAQRAIRLAATIRFRQNLHTADFSTLEIYYRQARIDEAVLKQTAELFHAAEACLFSGQSQNEDLSDYRRLFKTLLNAL